MTLTGRDVLRSIERAFFVLNEMFGKDGKPVVLNDDLDVIRHYSRANSVKISELGSEQGAKTAQNVAAGVAGLFIWPLWFAMDFPGAATKEIAALEARNAHLGERALQTCLASAQFETGAGATLPIADATRAPGLRKVHEPRVIPLLRE